MMGTKNKPYQGFAGFDPWNEPFEMNEASLRRMYPDEWAEIDAERAAAEKAKAAALYFEPYQQATGEFLEYACGRPIGGA